MQLAILIDCSESSLNRFGLNLNFAFKTASGCWKNSCGDFSRLVKDSLNGFGLDPQIVLASHMVAVMRLAILSSRERLKISGHNCPSVFGLDLQIVLEIV